MVASGWSLLEISWGVLSGTCSWHALGLSEDLFKRSP